MPEFQDVVIFDPPSPPPISMPFKGRIEISPTGVRRVFRSASDTDPAETIDPRAAKEETAATT